MVDFQSRDRRRGTEDEDDEDDSGRPLDEPEEEPHDHEDHAKKGHHHEHDVESLSAAVVTISSSRSLSNDPAGDAIVAALDDEGHDVVNRELIADDYDGVQSSLNALVRRDDVDAVVTTGGTGVTPDDVTIEAARPLFDKELPGFGELFRTLSYDEIGTKVVGTRATAGVANGVPVFCLPGSENAARLGAEEIIVAEAGHLAGLAKPDDEEGEDEDGS
ncbi:MULTISPECIES: MogA/MoaB family molybdenum cofactor biosynthesis protein [Halorussus]|uniref:MogA/MoaB family molybdenum cofactor biosynthesis protein n=1 Tax=Halorussus TaxID=1070314 RepID=UPI00209F8E6C|nr:MogA/MoaB family molybdenum cofactor biosynthesis protein [Halorussus vallis]USZ77267.1 MogA/MoaB family molybdenum cofactor biosynthesis protein [Halorussus vallis]